MPVHSNHVICFVICAISMAVIFTTICQGNNYIGKVDAQNLMGLQSQLIILNSKLLATIKERNMVSRRLNEKQQVVGQMECERGVNGDLKHVNVKTINHTKSGVVSSTGGWCQHESKEGGGHHMTDTHLADLLATFLEGKTVASFGDGPGRYKQLISNTGKVKVYDSYDGSPFSEINSKGRVKFLDLTLPQYGLPLYDWVISLEVGEHIPAQYEDVFVYNIVRHAKEGIVLSWAVPGQGGFKHVNGRTFEYVNDKLRNLGFKFQKSDTDIIRAGCTLRWLKTNINVYRRIDSSTVDMNIV